MIGFLILLVVAIVVILVVLSTKVTALTDKVRLLEWNLRDVQKTIAQQPQVIKTVPESQPAPSPASIPKEPPPKPPPITSSETWESVPPAQKIFSIPEKEPSRTREEFEAFVGGKLLNRIGALALVIGIGFFLKYAFENNWITETMRVAIGVVSGVGLLLGGIRTHKKGLEIFAQGLFGAGIAVLYLSVYASFNFYHLVPQAVAFGCMSCVTILAFVLAFKYDSLAISLLAWTGGFLTPFLLSTGSANEVGLFTYVTLLEAGLLAVVMKKPSWVILGPLTLAATYLIFFLWKNQYYTDSDLGITLFFVSVFWGLLYLADLYQTLSGASFQIHVRQVMSLFNGVSYYSIVYGLVNPLHHEWMGVTTLIICLAYFLQVIILRKYMGDSIMLSQNIFITMTLLVLATAIQYTGFTTVIFWSLEACALVLCARRWSIQHIAFFAIGLLTLALAKFAFTSGAFSYVPLEDFTSILNYRGLAYIILAAAFFSCAMLLKQFTDQTLSTAVTILHAAWVIVLLTFFTIEVNDFFMLQIPNSTVTQQQYLYFTKFMTMACVWIVYSIPLVYFGLNKETLPVVASGLMIVTITFCMAVIRGIAFSPIEIYYPLLNVRSLALLLVIAGMFVHYVFLKKNESKYSWIREVYSTMAVSAILLLLSLLTGETRDIFERQLYHARELSSGVYEELSRIENLKQLSLSGLWMVYGGILMGIGVWQRHRGIRIIAIVLFGIAILKIFVYDLSFLETLYRIFSFIGLGIILLTASYLYQKYKAIIFDGAAYK